MYTVKGFLRDIHGYIVVYNGVHGYFGVYKCLLKTGSLDNAIREF